MWFIEFLYASLPITACIEKINGLCRKMVQDEQTLWEKHTRARKIDIQKHKEEVHNLFDKGGVWLSSYWMKVLIMYFLINTGILVYLFR